MLCPIKQAAISSPNNLAIVHCNLQLTYQELDKKVSSLTNYLFKTNESTLAAIELSILDTILLIFASFRAGISLFLPSFRLPPSTKDYYLSFLQAKPISVPSNLPIIDSEGVISHSSSLLLLTSGSRKQKIVRLSYKQLAYNASCVNEYLELTENDSWTLSLPLFHVSGIGILFRIFLAKGSVVIPEKNSPLKGNYLSFVPTQLFRMMQNEIKVDRSQLKGIIVGGSKLGEWLYQKAIKEKLPVHITYGLTETASQILTTSNPTWIDGIPYLGEALKGHAIKLNEKQEILVQSKALFSRYENDQTELEDGWFVTKDLGDYLPSCGFACIGRADRMFISGGENIHPEYIERAILSIDGVISCMVMPIEDTEFGHRPIAYVQTNDPKISLQIIEKKLTGLIPKFMLPSKIFPWESAPKKGFFKEQNLTLSSL